MPSIEELLNEAESHMAAQPVNDVLEIDPETREISIPDSEIILGVETDQKAERKYFHCPKIVGNNIDLSTLALYVVFQNASNLDEGKDRYHVTDVATTSDGYITFSWELSAKVTAYKGDVQFGVCAIKTDSSGAKQNVWNTTIAIGQCLIGLSADMSESEEQSASDLYTQLISELNSTASAKLTEVTNQIQTVGQNQVSNVNSAGATQIQSIKDATDSALASIPSEYTDLDSSVKSLESAMRGNAPVIVESITCESGSQVQVTDSAEMPLQDMVLYGKSEQKTTTGAQLISTTKLGQSGTQAGVTWSMDKDGIMTLNGTCIQTSDISVTHNGTTPYNLELKAGTYTISGTSKNIRLAVWKNDDVTAPGNDYGNGSTFTISEKGIYGVYARVEEGITYNNVVIKPMLNLGSEALPFEPYTGGKPSPSPEYPQEIVSVGERWNGKRKVIANILYDGNDYYSQYTETQLKNLVGKQDMFTCNPTLNVSVGDIALFKCKTSDTNKILYEMIDVTSINVMEVTGTVIGITESHQSVGIEITGRNLFDISVWKNRGINASRGSIQWINDRSFRLIASANDCYTNTHNGSFIIKVNPRTKYTVFWRNKENVESINYVFEKDVNNKLIKNLTYSNQHTVGFVFETEPNCEYIEIRFGVSNANQSVTYSDIMIVEGDYGSVKRSDYIYEPYNKSTTTIPLSNGLPGIPVTSGGNYTDENGQQYICDEIDFARGKYVQRVWRGVFDGSEAWLAYERIITSVYTRKGFTAPLPSAPAESSTWNGRYVLANQGIVDSPRSDSTVGTDGMWLGVSSNKTIDIPYSSFYDDSLDDKGLANWKAHLASNPLVVMTYLDAPIETDLTESQLQAYKSLTTFKPTSIISNDAGAQMNVEYACDTKTWVVNKINTLIKEATTS